MALVAGVDGCPAGWICLTIAEPGATPKIAVYPDAESLLSQAPRPEVLAIDIPIGLTDRGPRLADLAARKQLGPPRGSSVFAAPIRAVLAAGAYAEASEISRAHQGKGLSIQSWGIVGKIRQVDAALRREPSRREWVREVHPELSFQAWRGGVGMPHPKRSREGRLEREALARTRYGPLLERIRPTWRKRDVADDDLLDAAAALWTAERIAAGCAVRHPSSPPTDSLGLSMEILC